VQILILIGACIITVDVMFDTYVRMYGVACVLLLLAAVCMFFFLQFEVVLVTTGAILLYYIGAGLVAKGEFPLVVIFLIAANFLYVRTAYSSEWYIRRDYIRNLKQQNEERRTTQFLEGMLPEVSPLVIWCGLDSD
jgi:hypothetical protein